MKILVLQKPEVLADQEVLIRTSLGELEGVPIALAGSPAEARAHPDARILIAPIVEWLPDALEDLPDVEWIHLLGTGVDRLRTMDLDPARYRLSESAGVHAATISEYVLGAVLYALKAFGTFARQQRERTWKRVRLHECSGKTLGVLGIGTVGRAVARRARVLGLHVIGAASEPRDIPHVDRVVGPGGLERVLRESDFLAVLLPLTDDTRGMLDDAAFRAMKASAWLINVARGEVVDEPALTRALQEGRIGGAVLDVFEEEPLARSSPLWDMENVLITPHVADTTQFHMADALEVFKENYRAFIRGGELVTPVSVEKAY